MTTTDSPILTAVEARALLRVGKHVFYRMVRDGEIERLPGTARILIPRSEIERLLRTREAA